MLSIDNDGDNDVEEDDDLLDEPFITKTEAINAINSLRTYIERCSNVNNDVFSAFVTIENAIDFHESASLVQRKITDFFK